MLGEFSEENGMETYLAAVAAILIIMGFWFSIGLILYSVFL